MLESWFTFCKSTLIFYFLVTFQLSSFLVSLSSYISINPFLSFNVSFKNKPVLFFISLNTHFFIIIHLFFRILLFDRLSLTYIKRNANLRTKFSIRLRIDKHFSKHLLFGERPTKCEHVNTKRISYKKCNNSSFTWSNKSHICTIPLEMWTAVNNL